MRTNDLLKRITSNEGIFRGKPIIRGMRFKVSDVLDYLSSGMTTAEILDDFPFLEEDDIYAALYYASTKLDHPILTVNFDAA